MMKIFPAVLAAVVLAAGTGFPRDVPSGRVKTRIVILPPRNDANRSVYVNADSTRAVIFNSLYSFLGILPDLDVADETLLTNAALSPLDVARKFQAERVLSGTFTMTGPKSDPTAEVTWTVTGVSDGATLFSRTYRTKTDIEIFDAVDTMIADSAKALVNRAVTIAQIAFNNFRIGDVIHAVELNGRTVATASNDSFSWSQKVPADSQFRVVVRRKTDGKAVLEETVRLKAGEARNISYKAPSGLQLYYEQSTLHLTPAGYVSQGLSYPFGCGGVPRDLLDKLKYSPKSQPFVYSYGANRTLGWGFVIGGGLGTILTLGTGNKNAYTNLNADQRSWLGIGYLAGTVACFTLSALFFNAADNDLEKAVWHYNRFILFEAEHARGKNTGPDAFPIIGFAAEF